MENNNKFVMISLVTSAIFYVGLKTITESLILSIILSIVLFFIVLIKLLPEETEEEEKPLTEEEKFEVEKYIKDKIKTSSDYEKFFDKIDDLNDKIADLKFDIEGSPTKNRLERMKKLKEEESFYSKVSERLQDYIIGYQFIIPESEFVNFSSEIFSLSYQTYLDLDSVPEILKGIENFNDYIVELTFEEGPEKKPKYFNDLIDIINENNTEGNGLIERLNSLHQKYKSDYDFKGQFYSFLHSDLKLSFGEIFNVHRLKELGAPKPLILAKEGVVTVADYLKINPEDFIAKEGIGPKLQKQLIEFQEKYS